MQGDAGDEPVLFAGFGAFSLKIKGISLRQYFLGRADPFQLWAAARDCSISVSFKVQPLVPLAMRLVAYRRCFNVNAWPSSCEVTRGIGFSIPFSTFQSLAMSLTNMPPGPM